MVTNAINVISSILHVQNKLKKEPLIVNSDNPCPQGVIFGF